MLCERCRLAMAFIFRKPSTACQSNHFNLSGSRGALQAHVRFTPESDIKCDKMECLLWAISGHSLFTYGLRFAWRNYCTLTFALRIMRAYSSFFLRINSLKSLPHKPAG